MSENEGPASESPREPESTPQEAAPVDAELPADEPEPEREPEPAPPPPAPAEPAAASAVVAAPAAVEPKPLGGPTYPVDVTFPRDRGQSRLWGIPFIGFVIRSFLVIPQLVVLFFLALVMYLVLLISWIPVLLLGRQAGFAYSIVGGYLRLSTRVASYVLLLTGHYPPFGPGGDHPVEVTFDQRERQHRLWGIPLIGLWIRWLLLIPHWILLALLGFVVGLLILVSWLPVLIKGRQADVIIQWVGGFYRWAIRVSAYAFLLTGRYPPFRLED